MSRDRFISFEKMPSPEAVLEAAVDFGGDLFTLTPPFHGRFFLQLPGEFEKYGETHQKRYIEVVFTTQIDVITRFVDDITNAVADGLARHIALKFKGKLNPDDFPKNGDSTP